MTNESSFSSGEHDLCTAPTGRGDRWRMTAARWRENCNGRKHVIVFGDMPPSEGSHDGTDGITVAYTWCVQRRVAHMGSIARKGVARKGVQGIRVTAGPFRPLWSSLTWGRSTSWRRCCRSGAGVRATGGTYATRVMVASVISRNVGPDRRDISRRGCTGGADRYKIPFTFTVKDREVCAA